jgi:hypothetical protein
MTNNKIKYIYKITIVLIIVVFVDVLSGLMFEKVYQKSPSGICYQENYIMNKTNQDLLVFGSSRAAYHYIPKILKDSLGLSVYNCGREGSGIYYHYGVLLATLKRYKPKVILLDIDYRDFYQHEGIFGLDILEEHNPFYHKISKEFDSLLVLKGFKEKIKLQSNLYKYNSKAFKMITSHFAGGRGNIDGFRSKNGTWKREILPLNANELILDQNKIATIKKFIAKTKENNIKLILTVSPYYMITPKDLYKPMENLAIENKIEFINHVQDSTFIKNAALFNDVLHLNLNGATLFTNKISSEVKFYLKDDFRKQKEKNN